MKGTIILLTKWFPFNLGEAPAEAFLENEIFVLAQEATAVIVFALDASENAETTVELPDHVEAYPVMGSKISKYLNLLRCSLREAFKPLPETKNERNAIKGLKRKAYLTYFTGKSDYYIERLCRVIYKHKIHLKDSDMIYNFWFYTYARVAVYLKQKEAINARICSRAHRYDLYANQYKMNYLPLRPWLLDHMQYVFPCSEDGSNYLKSNYPQYSNKIITAYLGSSDYGIEKSENKSEIFSIVSCSRLVPVKRVSLLLSALVCLEERHPELRFCWTHLGGGELYTRLCAKEKKRLHHNKAFITGTIPNREIISFYRDHYIDLFINVSESEGLPLSIMEASSFGIPVLATDVGGTKEIVENGINGWLIQKEVTAEKLGEKIYQIWNMDQEQLQNMRIEARKRWEEKFLIKENTKNMLRFCRGQ